MAPTSGRGRRTRSGSTSSLACAQVTCSPRCARWSVHRAVSAGMGCVRAHQGPRRRSGRSCPPRGSPSPPGRGEPENGLYPGPSPPGRGRGGDGDLGGLLEESARGAGWVMGGSAAGPVVVTGVEVLVEGRAVGCWDAARTMTHSARTIRCSSVPYRQGTVEVAPAIHPGCVNIETWQIAADWRDPGSGSAVSAIPESAFEATTEVELTPSEARALARALLDAADVAELPRLEIDGSRFATPAVAVAPRADGDEGQQAVSPPPSTSAPR